MFPEGQASMFNPASGDFSFASLFFEADVVVKSILIGLLIVSVISWTIMFAAALAQSRERRRTAVIEAGLSEVSSIDDLGVLSAMSDGAASRILRAIHDEWAWSQDNAGGSYDSVRPRLHSVASLAIGAEMQAINRRAPLLATIGSVAPFVGLFGTVWGIMRSFMQIGQYQEVSLAIVAPGIAEALLATAVGLFAAIPAVVAYNRLSQGLALLGQRWSAIAGSVEVAISRAFQAGA